jgi:hypothetical protein
MSTPELTTAHDTAGTVQSGAVSSLLPDADQHLTSGWEPDVPAADSVVRQAVLVHASWTVATARALGKASHDGAEWAGGHVGDAGALTNWVVVKQPLLDLDRVVTEARGLFPSGVPFLVVSAWPTSDLRHLGLSLVGHPPLMFRPWSEAVEASPVGIELRAASTAAELAEAERVLVDGYPITELQPFRPGRLYAPAMLETATTVIVAYDGVAALATASAHSAAGVTLVESVAAMPAARGRRVGGAVTAAATVAFPGQDAVLLASDDGQPVYERLGYHRLERWTVWLNG